MNEPRPMRIDIDLDWATYVCPCGDSLCTRWKSGHQIDRWIDTHAPHTNGLITESVTDDGARCLHTKPEDITREIRSGD